MINVFVLDFYTRLKAWHQLKEDLAQADLETICVKVDKFWQQCPMSAHYLHLADVDDWPNPWNLLNDNNYCYYARGLGMVYTLMLLGIKDIDFVEATDVRGDNVVLILVNNQYTMNYYPDSVLNIPIVEFNISKHIDVTRLIHKAGL